MSLRYSRRLRHDWRTFKRSPPCNCSWQEKDMLHFEIAMPGPPQSAYKDGVFLFDMTIPENYPMTPPKIICKTMIYHCNINNETGVINMIQLGTGWTPAYTISKLIVCVAALLTDSNPTNPTPSPLQQTAAKLLAIHPVAYNKIATLWTKFWTNKQNIDKYCNFYTDNHKTTSHEIYQQLLNHDDVYVSNVRKLCNQQFNKISLANEVLLYAGILPRHNFIKETMKWHKWIDGQTFKNNYHARIDQQYRLEKFTGLNVNGCVLPENYNPGNTGGFVLVKMIADRTQQFAVDLDFTIGNLKALINEGQKIDIRLILNGKSLDNNFQSLKSCGITYNCIIVEVVGFTPLGYHWI